MKVCIFCGAGESRDQKVYEEAKTVMKSFLDHKIELVYGGAAIGVMGALANELMSLGGKAHGVIPRQLMKKEIAHAGLTELHVVPDMHSRKKLMYDLSDAFLVFPGGMGTLDELFEILTWRQLGFHGKPIAILNINGYFDHLLKFLDHCVDQNLVKPQDRKLLSASSDWDEILTHFRNHK
jgi:uncharacterized protein (TIGR00730 family)